MGIVIGGMLLYHGGGSTIISAVSIGPVVVPATGLLEDNCIWYSISSTVIPA